MEELDRRVDGFEQFPPTLATGDGLHAAEHRIRTHFEVVAESLRNDIRPVAEAVAVIATYRGRRGVGVHDRKVAGRPRARSDSPISVPLCLVHGPQRPTLHFGVVHPRRRAGLRGAGTIG